MIGKSPKGLRGRVAAIQSTKKYAALNASYVRAQAQAAQAAQLAMTDPLTGLPNLLAFQHRLNAIVEQRESGKSNPHRRAADKKDYSLLFIDLDEFKRVNDTYGHDTGDLLLKHAVKSMKDALRKEDFIARIGGDEFVVLLSIASGIQEPLDIVGVIGENIRKMIESNLLVLNDEAKTVIPITSSIGGAVLADGESPEEMKENADLALYKAKGEATLKGISFTSKGNPRNRVALYVPGRAEPMLYSDYREGRNLAISFVPTVNKQEQGELSRRDKKRCPTQSIGIHLS
ncbi:MAG: GGDEF domain-containing protein [Alphaproteobacteria bacterium]|nr:GGDEF domain-containing protein [Alphaproteobacteria bacterium]